MQPERCRLTLIAAYQCQRLEIYGRRNYRFSAIDLSCTSFGRRAGHKNHRLTLWWLLPDRSTSLRSSAAACSKQASARVLAPPHWPFASLTFPVLRLVVASQRKYPSLRLGYFLWWLLPDSNWGHAALQAAALPTELKSHLPTMGIYWYG